MMNASTCRFEAGAGDLRDSCGAQNVEIKSGKRTLVQMSFEELQESIARDANPPDLPPPLKGLWHAAKGDWDAAHTCAQNDSSRNGSWVHAYLHREEGDLGNAGYWYARAGRPMPPQTVALQEEWAQIARVLLESA
jgi:hypothetical protein